jgi:hypothetical protein
LCAAALCPLIPKSKKLYIKFNIFVLYLVSIFHTPALTEHSDRVVIQSMMVESGEYLENDGVKISFLCTTDYFANSCSYIDA